MRYTKYIIIFLFLLSNQLFSQTTPDLNQVLNVDYNAYSMPISGVTKLTTDSLIINTPITSTGDSVLIRENGLIKYRYNYVWKITGNAGLTAGTNFIGTTDSIDFVTKTNSNERMRVTANGGVGIGTTTPSFYSLYSTGKNLAVSSSTANTYAALTLAGASIGGGAIDFGNQTITHAEIASTNGSNLVFYTNNSNSGTSLTERLRILSTGEIGINNTNPASTGTSLSIKKTIDNANPNIVYSNGQIQSTVTGIAQNFVSELNSAAASYTTSNYWHFEAYQNSIGSGNTITNQMGFYAHSSMTGATNNYGFYGNIASGTNRWNIYMNGTAQNYFAGYIGQNITVPLANLHIVQTATATGTLKGIIYTGSVNTNQTVNTEIPSITLTTAGRQWATGGIQTQREILINKPTYSFVGASTIRDAATLTIDAAPVAGTNATLTRSMALWTQSGLVRHDGTTEQLRVGYDSANYVSHTVGSSGSLTMAGTGTNTGMTFTNSGTGSFAFNSSTTTGANTSSALVLNANSLTSGTGVFATTSTIQDGNLMALNINSAGALDGQTALNIGVSGTNSNSNKTTYGIQSANTHTGTGAVNIGVYASASGGASNYAFIANAGSSGFLTSSPNSTVHINGSYAGAYVGKTANYTATSSDYCIAFTSGTDTLTLPTAVGITGRIYVYKNISGNNGVIATTSSQTIDGTAAPLTAIANKKSYILMSNGANWIVIAVF